MSRECSRGGICAQSVETDADRDGVAESVEVTVRVPLKPNEVVYRASCLLFFDYKIEARRRAAAVTAAAQRHVAGGWGVGRGWRGGEAGQEAHRCRPVRRIA